MMAERITDTFVKKVIKQFSDSKGEVIAEGRGNRVCTTAATTGLWALVSGSRRRASSASC